MREKNQPGVEYYIPLNQDCSELGVHNDKVGWQCKWFKTRANGDLTSSSKKQILHSLNKTDEHVSNLNRWILWTPFTLTKIDQDWFYGLKSIYSYQLDLWNADDIETFLEGPALELKGAYFGELALTPEILEQLHRESIAPIKERWIKEVHQQVDVEKKIRRRLGEPSAWDAFNDAGESLLNIGKTIEQLSNELDYSGWLGELKKFANSCSVLSSFAEFFKKTICAEDIESIHSMLNDDNVLPDDNIYSVLRKLRKNNLPLALELTNAIAYTKDIRNLLQTVSDSLSLSFIAVLADAGGGKTQMAAEITASQPDRPAGILLHGLQLRKGGSLDDLAQRISIYGKNIPNFSSLLAALDAAAYRNNCRLPLVIDGLNEAEAPQEWKPLLAIALEKLKAYPNILLVCTLRTGERARSRFGAQRHHSSDTRETFAQMALPEECTRLECEGFGNLTRDAVISYFQHYKIEADLTQMPEDFFNHPLNLRIFCEATNRNAEQVVKIDRFPASITTLFHKQIDYAAKRISELPNLKQSYSAQDIWKAIYYLGIQLWDSGQRSISEQLFLNSINQKDRTWDENIINLLAQEGILFRDPGETPYSYELTPTYDRLGGYIIADALLKQHQSDSAANWIKKQSCIDMLFGDRAVSHQLSQDIVYALVALMPQSFSQQLWMVVPDAYKDQILTLSTLIDAEKFCDETKNAYRKYLLSCDISSNTFLRLKRLRSSGGHPLNAEFFSSLMKELSVSDRDLSWTEFLRKHRDDELNEVQRFENRWKFDCSIRTEGDRLLAHWLSWILTSTCQDLRDYATKALYWYGRGATKELFKITIESLEINDPYVPERLIAASYGVAMHFACKGTLPVEVEWIAEQLYEHMFKKSASFSTTHLLARDYASKLIELVSKKLPNKFTSEQLINSKHPFPSMQRASWGLKEKGARIAGVDSPFHMKFENYTIGRLIPKRRNYDDTNPAYQEVRAKILWRVEVLGWNGTKFSEIDRMISSDSHYHHPNRAKTDRYGKKYSWIAYYEIAGQLLDEDKLQLWGERFAVDIDPSFPKPINDEIDDATYFLGSPEINTRKWITDSSLPDLNTFTSVDSIDDINGPWVLIDGEITEESKRLDRNFYVDISTFLLDSESLEKLTSKYESLGPEHITCPSLESTSNVYAGELYWSDMSKLNSKTQFEIVVGNDTEQIERPVMEYNRKDDGSVIMTTGKAEIVDVQVPIIEYIDSYFIAADFSWESEKSAMPGVHSKILSSEIFKKLNLFYDATTQQYYESSGKLAAKNVSNRGTVASNNRSLFYIRKDLLMKFMSEEDLKFIWCLKGERRLARMENFHSTHEDNIPYVDFSFYKPLIT